MELTNDQQRAYDEVVEKHNSVFITGRAGCGKTKVLHDIYEALVMQGYSVITVAFTGRAAMLLPGNPTTVSRNVGIRRGVLDFLPIGLAEAKLYKGALRRSVSSLSNRVDKRWFDEKLAIFIDEAGQLSSEEAYLFYEAGMYARQKEEIDERPLFVFSADFGQMQSIGGGFILDDPVFEYWEEKDKMVKVQFTSIVKQIDPVFVQLNQVVRQDNPHYLKALKWAYYGIALHPIILERFDHEPPPNTPKVQFNNQEVVKENEAYISHYLETHPEEARNARVYRAVYDAHNFARSDFNHLLPVTPELTVAKGMVFMVTENVPYPDDPKHLMVANGEQVVVEKLMPNSLEVRTRRGEVIELPFVQHSLPRDSNGNQPTFLQLPGYVGTSMTLYKVQGSTITTPTVFGAWCFMKGKRRSLKHNPGCLYVLLSRNTKIEDIYFDTSFGKEEAIALLKEAVCTNPIVEQHVLGKPPLWVTDFFKEREVLELDAVIPNEDGTYLVRYCRTDLKTGEESHYVLHLDIPSGSVYYSYRIEETEEFTEIDSKEIACLSSYIELAQTWLKHYAEGEALE